MPVVVRAAQSADSVSFALVWVNVGLQIIMFFAGHVGNTPLSVKTCYAATIVHAPSRNPDNPEDIIYNNAITENIGWWAAKWSMYWCQMVRAGPFDRPSKPASTQTQGPAGAHGAR